MNQNRRNKKDGKYKRKKNNRDWNFRFGNTALGRARNYIRLPVGITRQSRFGNRSIPTGDYITPRTQRSQLHHQSQRSRSEYQAQQQSQSEAELDGGSHAETPSHQQTPDPRLQPLPQSSSFTTPDPQSQHLIHSSASFDTHNTDIEMPASMEQTPMPAPSAPSTDEFNRNTFPSIKELQQRARQQFVLETPPDNNNNSDNRIAFGREFIDVIEAVRVFLPLYFNAILNTQEQRVIFRKYFKSICCQQGCLKLDNEKYCLRAWIKGKLSSKHYWHCSKSRGSKDYTCDCDQWQATDDMKCFHTLISTLADDYGNYKQPKIHVDIRKYQLTNADNVVYLATYRPS